MEIDKINWGFWGVVIAIAVPVISGVVAIRAYLKNRKRLSYNTTINTPIISNENTQAGKIKFLFNAHEVKNVHIGNVSIKNQGVPIPTSDFASPIKITTGANSQILSAEITNKDPDNLDTNIKINSNEIEISPLLLNTGDSFKIKIIGTDFQESFSVSSRILGIKRVTQESSKSSQINKTLAIVGLGGFILYLLTSIYVLPRNPPNTEPSTIDGIIMLVSLISCFGSAGAILAAMLISISKRDRYRKKRSKFLLRPVQRKLSYEVLSNNLLQNVGEQVGSQISLLLFDVPQENVSISVIRIANLGATLSANDFETPIVIWTGSNAKIISADVISKTDDLQIDVEIVENELRIKPLTLKYKDSFTIKLIGTNFVNNFLFSARITGVNKIQELTEPSKKYSRLLNIGTSTSLIVCLLGIVLTAICLLLLPKDSSITIAFGVITIFSLFSGIGLVVASGFYDEYRSSSS